MEKLEAYFSSKLDMYKLLTVDTNVHIALLRIGYFFDQAKNTEALDLFKRF